MVLFEFACFSPNYACFIFQNLFEVLIMNEFGGQGSIYS